MKKIKIDGKMIPVGEDRMNCGYEHPFPCPVCGKFAFAQDGNYDVCPFCGWENEKVQNHDLDCKFHSPNKVNLRAARENYKKIGAICEEDLSIVQALKTRFFEGKIPHNATMYKHIAEFVEGADPVAMIEKA